MADFSNYVQLEAWLGKGKKREVGRRKRAFMFRMNAEGVIIVSHARKHWVKQEDNSMWKLTDFAELRPTNVLTFTCETSDMVPIAASMSSTFWRIFGLAWHRMGRGRYVLFHWDGVHSYLTYWEQLKKGHEHFKGMSWDLIEHKCYNPKPPILKTVDKDNRKEWVAALRKFRRAVHVRIKLGVVQEMINRGPDGGKRVYDNELSDAVLDALQSGEVHTDLLERLIINTKRASYHRPVSPEKVKQLVESILNGYSVPFRQAFGVLRK